jgi:hypothetical protein
MNEGAEGRAPEGRSEAEAAELGEPERGDQRDLGAPEEEEARPDLDERERRIRLQRRPMGPPLEEPTEREESLRRERTEGPTDPD